jgi:hypothetical protein
MKTRALLTCDTRVLESTVRGLKPKELRRHIDRIAADLGAPDTDALLGQILEAVLGLGDEGQASPGDERQDEAEAIVRSLEDQIEITDENKDLALRLIVIALAYLRQLMARQIQESRRARRDAHRHQHQDGHQCGDPHCPEHGTHTADG